MNILKTIAVAAGLMAAQAILPPTASAGPMPTGSGVAASSGSLVTDVQWRRHGYRPHRPGHWAGRSRHWGPRYGYRGPRYGYRHRHGNGAAAAAGIAGLATGAIIGGALAQQNRANDAVAYCSQRFRSYDPRSGTYLGYDGLRHPCP